jgi:NAD(P)-dependent dehydrogenase (short-subunit alcohol dehydrogenase family)
MTLKGKTILITGAARRIGHSAALAVAKAGGNVIIHYGSAQAAAYETKQAAEGLGVKAWTIQADLEDPQAAAELIEQAWNFSPLFGLINNAAVFEALTWQDTTIPDWQRHLQINLTAPFLLSQSFARRLGSSQRGRIINMNDWRALRPGADHFPYTISKAALSALTRSLAQGLAPNITVNELALGAILPPSDGAEPAGLLKNIPAERWASLDEVGQSIIFLLDGPDYMTGETLHLDGGRHLV